MNAKLKNTAVFTDPDDAPDMSTSDLSQGVWQIDGKTVSEAEGKAAMKRRGRPLGTTKRPATLRIEEHALALWRASGKGWQTRAAAVLADYAAKKLATR